LEKIISKYANKRLLDDKKLSDISLVIG